MKKSLKTITGYYNRIGFNIEEFVMAEAQTVINVSYKVGFIRVIREGLELKPSEFTATDGTTVTLTYSARKGEVIKIEKELKV